MRITEVRIKLMDNADDRLQAFCSITLDDSFVVRDLKIIEGANGPFVAMPSRKLTAHCPQCGCKNHLRAAHCNQCGMRLKDDLAIKDQEGRAKLYADIAHPINSQCREMIQDRVIAEFHAELEKAKQPGYRSTYDEIYDYEEGTVSSSSDGSRQAVTREPGGEKPRVQPPVTEPRPPHGPGVPRHAAERPSAKRNDDNFGAGIL